MTFNPYPSWTICSTHCYVCNGSETADGLEDQVLNAAPISVCVLKWFVSVPPLPHPPCRTTRTPCRLRYWSQRGTNTAQSSLGPTFQMGNSATSRTTRSANCMNSCSNPPNLTDSLTSRRTPSEPVGHLCTKQKYARTVEARCYHYFRPLIYYLWVPLLKSGTQRQSKGF